MSQVKQRYFHTQFEVDGSVCVYVGHEPFCIVPTEALGDRLADVLNEIVDHNVQNLTADKVFIGLDPSQGPDMGAIVSWRTNDGKLIFNDIATTIGIQDQG